MKFAPAVRPLARPLATAALAAFMLAGCAHYGAADSAPQGEAVSQAAGPAISLELSPCFGFCPTFAITVEPDGEGIYDGTRFVKTEGERRFTVSPQDYAAFRDRLADFRPAKSVRYDYENCDGPVATDHPSVKVSWTQADGETQVLDWYMGCRQPELSENSDAIYRAWQELPEVVALVGTDEERRPQ